MSAALGKGEEHVKNANVWILGLMVLCLCTAKVSLAEENEKEGDKIALDQVPADVKAAAEKSVPGFAATSAEKETKNGAVVYELKGTANGKTIEVKVGADGKVSTSKEGDDDKDEGKGKHHGHKHGEDKEKGEK